MKFKIRVLILKKILITHQRKIYQKSFIFFGQSGEKGEWENLDQLFEVDEFEPSEFNIHIANLDGLKIVYGISHKNNEKVLLSVESSNPNFQNFEVRMGDDV